MTAVLDSPPGTLDRFSSPLYTVAEAARYLDVPASTHATQTQVTTVERATGIEPAFSAWEAAPKASTGIRQRAKPQVSALIASAAVRRYPSPFPPIGHVAGTSILASRCSRKGSSIELTPPSGG